MSKSCDWPRWMVGPNGERRVFASSDAVPAGWVTKAEARKATEQAAAKEAAPPKKRAKG